MTIEEYFRTAQAGIAELIIPDCGHSADHVDTAPGGVWTCFHEDHTMDNGRRGIPIPQFASLNF